MLRPYLKKLIEGKTLDVEESFAAARVLFSYDKNLEAKFQGVNREQIAALLALISRNGVTAEELVGFARATRLDEITVNYAKPVLDIVGTGGDCTNTINISTTSALLIASCGVTVIKHGTHAVTSKCGSADVLEALGYFINNDANDVIENVTANNFAFCLAPKFHPILFKIRELRKDLGVPSIFNILGPLLNPAHAKHIVLGVYGPHLVDAVANALFILGTKKSIVFSGIGTDELTCLGKTHAKIVTASGIEDIVIDPDALGLRACNIEDLTGDDAMYNAAIIKKTLAGTDTGITDTIILNTAVALFIYGTVESIAAGIIVARDRLKAGNILKINKLNEIIERKELELPILPQKSLKAQILKAKNGAVIAEIKRASPSKGKIAEIIDPVYRAKQYVEAGAHAISVLTDAGFEGTIDDLKAVATALKDTDAAILCKDFFIHPLQIARAAEAGANAILIMISVLGADANRLINIAHEFGLETLVEVHSLKELEIALKTNADVIGVNQRDLRDFSMHPHVYEDIIKHIPENVVMVAESGIENKKDANAVFAMGYKAVLVGTALSKLDNPREFFEVK